MKNTKPLVIILIVALLGFLCIGVVGFYAFKQSLIEAKKVEIATILNISRNQSSVYISQHKQGLLTKEQTDQKIIAFLSAMQHQSAYVWSNDNFGIARVHARKDIIGQFQQSYVGHMATLANQEIAFLSESNIKPISDRRVLKINGFTKIPEWDWVVGYGVYMDDIDRSMFKMKLLFTMSLAFSILMVVVVTIYLQRHEKEA